MSRGRGDPADWPWVEAGAASTILGVGGEPPGGPRFPVPLEVVDVVGPGPAVEVTVCSATPFPPAPVVGDEVPPTATVGCAPPPPMVAGAGAGTADVVVVVAAVDVVVDPAPLVLVARTALGGNGGCTPGSTGPNVQASTLPAGGW